ncbi:copper transporter [Acrocarpospora catenulata]|uniref:copper transporter n=1 Tax=Acrocarpospora catenulata TaxID=2836182 RepID=UPI001BDA4252|nr:copper transporter [Acrocarpospora catenulata]
MIDFRYHLVSIVAIFLALTVGIVLGSTVLQDPIISSTQVAADTIRKENLGLRDQIAVLQSQQDGNSSFVTGATHELVNGDLAGARVVVVEAPGAPSGLRDEVREVLEQAGAFYTGRVALTEKFLAPEQTAVVDGLATQLAPAGTIFREGASPYDKAGQVLASALVTNMPVNAGTVNVAASSVLDVFQDGGFITVSDDPGKRATLAVLVAPTTPYEGEAAQAQNGAVVSVAGALDNGGLGTVLAGNTSASATGGVIEALLDSGEASHVSSVDTLDMPAGRVVVVYALREQQTGRSGAYGIGSGASAFEPPPVVPADASPSPAETGG